MFKDAKMCLNIIQTNNIMIPKVIFLTLKSLKDFDEFQHRSRLDLGERHRLHIVAKFKVYGRKW